MAELLDQQNAFVVDLLSTLRHEKFSPKAWIHFFQHSWERSCNTANANLTLKRSWRYITLLNGALTLTILAACYVLEGSSTAIHLFSGFVFFVAWQQSDLFWHLGLNRQTQTGILLPVIGAANILTGLRGLGAAFLLGRIVGGIPTLSGLALLVFLAGVITDILDGQIASRTKTQSKLGQIIDGEADFCLYLAMTIILVQNSVLPLWLGLIMLLRFLIPLLATLGSYFLFAQPVRFGSTAWGKYAGLAQCLYFLMLLAPPQLTFLVRFIQLPLLVTTLILLLAAPLSQIVKNVRSTHG